jgi:hypothetical protein
MRTMTRPRNGSVVGILAFLLCAIGTAGAEDAKPAYPAMAPIGQYHMASPADEVALARSAAPTSISSDASVLSLGNHGYETAAKGKNGFVCMVWRSWATGFDDAEFWNPKLRSPICLNSAAARTVLPPYLRRTEWAIEGASKAEIMNRTKTELAANRIATPGPGAMAYMMSKQGNLNDLAGHWHPHLMFFVAHTDGAVWGADLDGSPIFAAQSDPEPVTTFIVPVTKWSDGTSSVMEKH